MIVDQLNKIEFFWVEHNRSYNFALIEKRGNGDAFSKKKKARHDTANNAVVPSPGASPNSLSVGKRNFAISILPRLLNMMMLRFLMRVKVLARLRLHVERIYGVLGKISVGFVVRRRRHLIRRRIFLGDFGLFSFVLGNFVSRLLFLSFLRFTGNPFVLNHTHPANLNSRGSASLQIGRVTRRRHLHKLRQWVKAEELKTVESDYRLGESKITTLRSTKQRVTTRKL